MLQSGIQSIVSYLKYTGSDRDGRHTLTYSLHKGVNGTGVAILLHNMAPTADKGPQLTSQTLPWQIHCLDLQYTLT